MKLLLTSIIMLAAMIASPAQTPNRAQHYFTDVVLVNQEGRQLRLYSDLMQGKTVIINSFFTSCNSVCPPMSRNLELIQDWLGERLGKQATILSISVDPTTDTPPRLKDYAARFHAKPGWHFLTGDKQNVELALGKFGQLFESKDDHSTLIIIGNEPTGLWKKALGMARPDELIRIVESVVVDKQLEKPESSR